MPNPGKGIGHYTEGRHRFQPAAALHVDIELQQTIQLARRGGADDQHAQRIANEVAGLGVFEQVGIAGEDLTRLGLFHVDFEHAGSGALHQAEDLVQHAEVAQVEAGVEGGRAKNGRHTVSHFAHDARGIGDHGDAEGSTAYDQ